MLAAIFTGYRSMHIGTISDDHWADSIMDFFFYGCIDCVNHYEKLSFFKNKISVLEVEL